MNDIIKVIALRPKKRPRFLHCRSQRPADTDSKLLITAVELVFVGVEIVWLPSRTHEQLVALYEIGRKNAQMHL